MKIVTAKYAGFCFGVKRALSMCENIVDLGKKTVTLGPLIHNSHVIDDLSKKGVGIILSVDDYQDGDTVIIRSHGATEEQVNFLYSKGADVVDATCPYVKRIHEIVREESKNNRLIAIIGDCDHPEIAAICGYCDEYIIFASPDEAQKWLKEGDNSQKPISFVFQTTSNETNYQSIVKIAKKECTNSKVFDTICNATSKRLKEAYDLSKTVDVVIAIGDKNSANSLGLADICKENCQRTFFIQSADDLDGLDIRFDDTVGITAGASTPAWIIKEVTHKMMNEDVKQNETGEDFTKELNDIVPEIAVESSNSDDSLNTSDNIAIQTDDPGFESAGLDIASDSKSDLGVDAALETTTLPAEVLEEISGAETLQESSVEPETVISDESTEPKEDIITQESLPNVETNASEDDVSIINTGIQDTDSDIGDDDQISDRSFDELLEESAIKIIHTGQRVMGIVTSITTTEVSVDLGTKQSGYIPISEFTEDRDANIDDYIKVGDSIESFVMRVNDVEGTVMLSKKRLDAIRNWTDIEAARDEKTPLEGIVNESNKGGVVVNIKGIRIFVPASQTGLAKNVPMTDIVGKSVKLIVTEVNQSRRRVVGSIRAALADERREKSGRVWEDIEVGKQYDGVVKSMTSYGVFVDIGGVDGMIHISELSWTRIKHPSEVMSIGDNVSVYVLSFDKEAKKISLGYKKNEDNPWTRFTNTYFVGDTINVKIVKMMPFGAFAEICPGVDGLIHISQITDHRIGLPSEVLSDGQEVDVKLTEIDFERKKVSLSIRALMNPSSQPLTNRQIEEAAESDNTPVILYDTDSPPTDDTVFDSDLSNLGEDIQDDIDITLSDPEEAGTNSAGDSQSDNDETGSDLSDDNTQPDDD